MWDIELAKELKKRDNKEIISPQIGEVISVSPLKIAILGNKAILTNKEYYLCNKLVGVYTIGDNVLCLPTADGQKYYIIDKVVI